MKIAVFSVEDSHLYAEQYELDVDNKKLIDVAFNIQNFYLSNLTQTEPFDEEVVIKVFYDDSRRINWAFDGEPSEQAKSAVRNAMARYPQ